MKIPPHKLGLVFSHYFVRQSNCTNKKHKITSYVSVLLFLIFSLQTVCLAVCIPASQGAIGCLEPVYLKEHMYECMLKCMHVYFAFFAQVGQIEATEAQRIMNWHLHFSSEYICHLYVSEIVWTKSLNIIMSIEKFFCVRVKKKTKHFLFWYMNYL